MLRIGKTLKLWGEKTMQKEWRNFKVVQLDSYVGEMVKFCNCRVGKRCIMNGFLLILSHLFDSEKNIILSDFFYY